MIGDLNRASGDGKEGNKSKVSHGAISSSSITLVSPRVVNDSESARVMGAQTV